jgi:hypothetical protein
MYFGALSVGADLAGGLHGFYHAKALNVTPSLAFKSFRAHFLKRPEGNVYFLCSMGEQVLEMLKLSIQSGERINKMLTITAYTHYFSTR